MAIHSSAESKLTELETQMEENTNVIEKCVLKSRLIDIIKSHYGMFDEWDEWTVDFYVENGKFTGFKRVRPFKESYEKIQPRWLLTHILLHYYGRDLDRRGAQIQYVIKNKELIGYKFLQPSSGKENAS